MDTTETEKRKREDTDDQNPQYTKKKKQFVGKTTFIAEDEDEDILVTGWFYIDQYGAKQGPFTTKEMKQWYIDGFFGGHTQIKRVSDLDFGNLADRDEFSRIEQKNAFGLLLSQTGILLPIDQETAITPADDDYDDDEEANDNEAGQDQGSVGPQKISKKAIAKAFKKKRIDKQRRRILAM